MAQKVRLGDREVTIIRYFTQKMKIIYEKANGIFVRADGSAIDESDLAIIAEPHKTRAAKQVSGKVDIPEDPPEPEPEVEGYAEPPTSKKGVGRPKRNR